MINIYNKIIDRLQQSIDRPSIVKFFEFSIEELQDNPDRLRDIAEYLKLHEDKYEDFEIHTWIDSTTMKPVFMIKLYPNEDIRKNIQTGRISKLITYFQNLN
jgi:hypothetical protein